MSTATNFSRKRKKAVRGFSALVDMLVAISKPLAGQPGIELQARLDEALMRRAEEQQLLAERLQRSVLPLFIEDDEGRPDRIGSCVLARLDSSYYAFTAAHVIRDAGSWRLLAPAGGKLRPCRGAPRT